MQYIKKFEYGLRGEKLREPVYLVKYNKYYNDFIYRGEAFTVDTTIFYNSNKIPYSQAISMYQYDIMHEVYRIDNKLDAAAKIENQKTCEEALDEFFKLLDAA